MNPADLGFYERRPGSGIWYHPDVTGATYEPRTCEGCGDHFMGRRKPGGQLFCTNACAKRQTRKSNSSYSAVHQLIRRERGSASEQTCVDCGQPAAEWSQIHGTDGCDVHQRYEPRCEPCHRVHDASRGEEHYAAKLTEARVRGIRASVGANNQELADLHGVARATVQSIRAGKTWKHVQPLTADFPGARESSSQPRRQEPGTGDQSERTGGRPT